MDSSTTLNLELYEPIETLVARYETRRDEIQAVVDAADKAGLKLRSDYLTEHRRDTWKDVLDRTQAMTYMSTTKQKDVTSLLFDTPHKLPDFTYDTLTAWLKDLMSNSPVMLTELCKEAFEILTPQKRYEWADGYKTNEDKREIPRSGKVILTRLCHSPSTWEKQHGAGPQLSHYANRIMHVLDRVFSLLDGKKTPVYPHDSYSVCRAAEQANEREAETTYFKFKMHLNGNLHLTLKRADLVKTLVAIAAGANLKEGEKEGKETCKSE